MSAMIFPRRSTRSALIFPGKFNAVMIFPSDRIYCNIGLTQGVFNYVIICWTFVSRLIVRLARLAQEVFSCCRGNISMHANQRWYKLDILLPTQKMNMIPSVLGEHRISVLVNVVWTLLFAVQASPSWGSSGRWKGEGILQCILR